MDPIIALENQYSAHTVNSLPIVLVKGHGCQVQDTKGNSYLDFASALAVNNFGHCHPDIVAAAQQQVAKLTMCSRLFYNEHLGTLSEKVCQLTGLNQALPMNSGAEAFETAVKASRRWGYSRKDIAEDQAEIIMCHNNFHGRTVTAISASTKQNHRTQFGPFTPGFTFIDFNNADALEKAIHHNTVAFIVEPIQGEGGVIIPDQDYLQKCADICQKHNVLFILDEIQTGVGRTGQFLACQHHDVLPDGVLLGKGLGGGVLPVSMLVGKKSLMSIFTPGSHGSTFAGSPFACAVSIAALNVLVKEKLSDNAQTLGQYFLEQLQTFSHSAIRAVRGKGLLVAIEFDADQIDVAELCQQLAQAGLLVINTHNYLIRLAPPLNIGRSEIDQAVAILKKVLAA